VQVLSAEVASYLGLELGKIKIKRFADGEIYVQVQVRPSVASAQHSSSAGMCLSCACMGMIINRAVGGCLSLHLHMQLHAQQQCSATACPRPASAHLTELQRMPVGVWLVGSLPPVSCRKLYDFSCPDQVLTGVCAGLPLQESIRGCDVFLVQPTCPPVNDNLMELLVTIDACRRASARSITAVLPYYGYARADRKTQVRHAAACSRQQLCAERFRELAGICV
jgi:hypothetical protein